MCRLFAMSAGATPARATFWLLGAPDSLALQSRREPDGTGLGWFGAEGEPHVSKQPIAAYEDRAFAREAREVSSRTFVAHVRFASTGALARRNTHPFEQGGRLFAHNGVVEGLEELDAHLGGDLRMVRGETDSERLFALITRETRRAGGDLGAGIETACVWVAANLPVFAMNFVLAAPDALWALRYPATHPLYALERGPGSPLEQRGRLGSRVRSDEGAQRALVVVASEPMDADRAWRELAPGELLHVDGALRVSRRTILHAPPSHPLTLAALSERARSSQAAIGATASAAPASAPAPQER